MKTTLNQIAEKCKERAKFFAQLELDNWNENHERELKTHFDFNNKTLAKRKSRLLNDVKNQSHENTKIIKE